MHIGAFIFPTEYSIRIDELARALEERNMESLFVTEHTHIPASRRTPWPGGGPLPREYAHTLDPFVGLAAAAAVTSRLRVGTGICLIIQHDPIVTAKEVATLDLLSNGRFLFGVGAGWNVEEIENHGTAFPTRFRVMRERVLAMKEIWTKEAAAFHGEFVRFDPMWSYPKPVQKPHPPVLLGGEGPHTLRRVVEFCDGWFPRARAGVDAILAQLADLRAQGATRRPSRSPCSAGRRTRPCSTGTGRPGSTASCSRCRPRDGRRSCPSWTDTPPCSADPAGAPAPALLRTATRTTSRPRGPMPSGSAPPPPWRRPPSPGPRGSGRVRTATTRSRGSA
jgi:probable F420-dependent oxidoreductase